jgi:hypothetical protein
MPQGRVPIQRAAVSQPNPVCRHLVGEEANLGCM